MAHNTLVGKEILDMLMFSMYSEPYTIYREYIQNAYDSIREATEPDENGFKLLDGLNDGNVCINTDKSNRTITIYDNGTGIPAADSEQRLKDIGRSIKRYLRSLNKSRAGWFGVGRLVGAGYCEQLIFKTTAYGESVATQLTFDVNKIREILDDDTIDMEAGPVIDTATVFIDNIPAKSDEHWFEVTLSGVLPDYDILLDHNTIKNYICQVAPLQYGLMFKRLIKKCETQQDKKYFAGIDYIRINLNDEHDLKKRYSDRIEGTDDKIEGMNVFELKDGDSVLAWGWYALTRFTKQIEDTEASSLTRGMRLRIHNIQIGDLNYFGGKNYFREARGNEFFNGEIHVVDKDINPTSDRSELEPSKKALKLKELIKDYFGNKMQPVYKAANDAKNAIKLYSEAQRNIEDTTEKQISETFTKEVKEDNIKRFEEQKEEAVSKFSTLIKKNDKSDTPEGVKKVISLYKTEAESQNVGIVCESVEFLEKKSNEKKTVESPSNLEEKIQALSSRYNAKQISIIKKCFKLMDKFYGKKHPDLIKSIQYSIVNGLLS